MCRPVSRRIDPMKHLKIEVEERSRCNHRLHHFKFTDKLNIYIYLTSITSRRRCLGMMTGICLGIYMQAHKPAGLPVDTVVEILPPVDHFHRQVSFQLSVAKFYHLQADIPAKKKKEKTSPRGQSKNL
ncbi:hypothetical protein ACTXT7_011106 [Hymenolepis weldensis]